MRNMRFFRRKLSQDLLDVKLLRLKILQLDFGGFCNNEGMLKIAVYDVCQQQQTRQMACWHQKVGNGRARMLTTPSLVAVRRHRDTRRTSRGLSPLSSHIHFHAEKPLGAHSIQFPRAHPIHHGRIRY